MPAATKMTYMDTPTFFATPGYGDRQLRKFHYSQVVRYGDRDYADTLAPTSRWVDVRVDGRPKILESRIAALLCNMRAREQGLELPNATWRAA